MELEQQKLLLTYPDRVIIMAFLVQARGSVLPFGAQWVAPGWWRRECTPENVAEELSRANVTLNLSHGVAAPVSWRKIEPTEVPEDRSFRDAWIDDGNAIVHDMEKAKEIHRDRLRRQRAAALVDLDGQWMRATGTKDQAEADAIEAQRQELRDVPADPRIDAALSIDDLKAVKLPVQSKDGAESEGALGR